MTVRQHHQLVRALATRADGQTMAEYGVVLALITLVVIGALSALAVAMSSRFGDITNVLGSSL